ncbi:MAG TPA: CGNR zinc finger domain-containing protein [Candidatus Limnocylindrales bacterium]|nr:CGNR zinc finger domain-containing protein [Candidatus Limnocylindrales bacterium]
MAERETASGELGLVQAFVNTLDALPGSEELRDPNTLQTWLVANGLMDAGQEVDESDLRHALAVREAMRAVIGGNTGHRVYPVEVATLNEAAGASRLRMRFGPDGKARLEPEASGPVGAIGRLVATLYSAMQDEGWERLKLCGSDACRWAFYDRSKNRSSRWCTMESCGNREKARRFRAQKKLAGDSLHRHA